ncbi:guanylate-binding protein [Pelagophyceae sp. CCMP2097]|nr:guanylate-binding protein [Pelagophyceae sp. CCMP2097]
MGKKNPVTMPPKAPAPAQADAADAPPPSPAKKGTPKTSMGGKGKMKSKFRKEPIPLVEVDDESKFSVNPLAREILSELDGKVCIVSVAGLYRTGKSSLVNFLLEEESGFTVGPTIKRCTRGIWFWGAPRRAALPSGEPCWVVLLDTEGLGGLEADAHYDTRIFSLATLMCSTLVYNSLGSIDESAISNLSFVANLSQHIRVSDHGEAASELDAHEFHKFFPSFVWVVRDFALDLVDEYGTAIDSDEYLDRALRTQVGFDAATTERNRVRQMMTAFFTERHCFPLVRPLSDETVLQEIDKVPFSTLRPAFQEGVAGLKAHIYESHLKPKMLGDRALNGAAFIGLVEQYILAIEGGSVPTISTAWEEVMIRECSDARSAALGVYVEGMGEMFDGSTSVSTDKLYKAHSSAQKKAVLYFRSRAGGEQSAKIQEELEEEIGIKLSEILRTNEKVSRDACTTSIKKLHEDLVLPKTVAESHEAYSDLASLRYDLSTLSAKYAAVAAGPARDGVLAEYALGASLDAAQWLFERVDDVHEKHVVELEAACSEAAQAKARIEAHEKVVTDALEQQQRELIAVSTSRMQVEAQLKAQEARMTSILAELQRSNRKKEELEHDLEDTKDALESEQTWQAQLHSRLEEMETKSGLKESKLDELGSLLERHKKEGDERSVLLEQHKTREATLAEQVAAWEAKHRAIVVAHAAAETKRLALEHKAEELGLLASREADRVKETLDRLAKLQDEHDFLRAELEQTTGKLAAATSAAGASAVELEQRLDAKELELDAAADAIGASGEKLKVAEAESASKTVSLDESTRKLESAQAELDGAAATHAELLRAHAALGSEHRTFQQKMNQRITYLKSQLDEHSSSSSTTVGELQRKAVREVELEKRLEVEINLRATMASDKDAMVFDLQKKLAEATTRLRQTETRSNALKQQLESAQAELNQIAAQRAVLLDEKEKMQALWEKSLTDHFNSLHETQAELEEHKARSTDKGTTSSAKMGEMESKLSEYRQIVERVQTRKEGLLRKRTRSRLVKQTWHVKQFRVVGHALLHRDTDNSGHGEKTFTLDAKAAVEVLTEANSGGGRVMRNSFRLTSGDGNKEELILAAIDRLDMQEWIDALNEVITDLAGKDAKHEDIKKRFKEEPN